MRLHFDRVRFGPFQNRKMSHLAIVRSVLVLISGAGDKDQFLDLVRSNENMGSDYIENDFMSPTTEEIMNARPLVAVLPENIESCATLIASEFTGELPREAAGW